MALPRYRSSELPYGVTREAISWLGPAKQRGVIVRWLEDNFDIRSSDHVLFHEEDTFDVFEEVWDEFDGLVPPDVIDGALTEAAAMGEWVPRRTPRRAQVERYDTQRLAELLRQAQTSRVRIGNASELRSRAELESILAGLRRCIAEIDGIAGGVGDNGGPVDVSTPAGQFAHLKSHIGRIAKQAASNSPDALALAQSAMAIQGIAETNRWLDEQMRDGAAAYIRAFCETSGKNHAHMLSASLMMFIILVFNLLGACVGWLEIALTH